MLDDLDGAGVDILSQDFWVRSLPYNHASWIVVPTGRTSWVNLSFDSIPRTPSITDELRALTGTVLVQMMHGRHLKHWQQLLPEGARISPAHGRSRLFRRSLPSVTRMAAKGFGIWLHDTLIEYWQVMFLNNPFVKCF